MYESQDLKRMINGHLDNCVIDTDFSSWAACITVASMFAFALWDS